MYHDRELAGTIETQGSGGGRGFWALLWVGLRIAWEEGLSRLQNIEDSGESSQVRDSPQGS